MTERFDWTHDGMELDECGDYVRFADAQAEIARLRGALEEINRATFDDDANRIAHSALQK